MPKGKMRSQEELVNFAKSVNKRRRPLLKDLERLNIAAGIIEFVMGGDDPFAAPKVEEVENTAESEEVEAEAE